jgi:hypothetical protein
MVSLRGDDPTESSVRGGPHGLWRFPYSSPDGVSPPRFGPAKRVGDGPRWPRQSLPGGALLATHRVGAKKYTPHEARLHWAGSNRPAQTLADDLHHNQSAVVRPKLRGDGGLLELAYVRFGDGSIILRSFTTDTPSAELRRKTDRMLWKGSRPARDLAWSPNGHWLAFTGPDDDMKPWVYVSDVASGKAYRVSRGLRAAWGPLSSRNSNARFDIHRYEQGKIAVIKATVAADGSLIAIPDGEDDENNEDVNVRFPRKLPLGLGVRITADGIVCSRDAAGKTIRYVTYERSGGRKAYGVYALSGDKNHLPVPMPLSGKAIAYPDRNHAQAVSHLLSLNGLPEEVAEQFVATRNTKWFGEGLRVLFVVPASVGREPAGLNLSSRCCVLVICVNIRR